jgi:hypothetical protein
VLNVSAYSRFRSASKWGVMPVSVLLSGLVVWQSSYAAFSSSTVNPSNSFGSGSVVLGDDDSGTAMFTPTLLKPLDTGTKCIVVTSTGTLASTVELYATSYSTTNALGSYLDMVIDEGTGGSFASSGPTSCANFVFGTNIFTGTLASFGTTKTSFATGVGTWAPAGTGSPTKTYRIKYTLNTATPNTSQSGTAALGFTWEAQNS